MDFLGLNKGFDLGLDLRSVTEIGGKGRFKCLSMAADIKEDAKSGRTGIKQLT